MNYSSLKAHLVHFEQQLCIKPKSLNMWHKYSEVIMMTTIDDNCTCQKDKMGYSARGKSTDAKHYDDVGSIVWISRCSMSVSGRGEGKEIDKSKMITILIMSMSLGMSLGMTMMISMMKMMIDHLGKGAK